MQAVALILELLGVGLAALLLHRLLRGAWKTRGTFVLKAYLTVRVMWLILFHERDGVTVYEVLGERIQALDLRVFIGFALAATAIKLVGIGASITRWILMLRGQGIELPVRHIVGAFFTGRFLGTFLPSTLGLDGYKLYDAARFSGRSVEVSTATLVEKLLGLSGIFGTFLIALPFGISIFGDYAPLIAVVGVPVALAPLGLVAIAFFWPGPALVRFAIERLPLPTFHRALERVADGATAYSRHKALLLGAWGLSLVSHFTTAAMYYFTARALGVRADSAGFWEVTFASAIQIFATVISPFTVAGEGIRELAQGLLLQNQMTFAVAAASGLLGFLAAEAPTLLGAIPWILRGERYRPAHCLVDGAQVDYEQARRAAADLGVGAGESGAAGQPDPTLPRIARGALLGLAAGLYAGLVIGFGEAGYLLFLGKVTDEAQVFWVAPLAYGLLLGLAGGVGGAALGVLPIPRLVMERWIPALGFAACLVPFSLIATVFFLYRDFYGEKLPPVALLAGVVGVHALAALVLFAAVRLLAATPVRRLFAARVAVPTFLAFVLLAGAVSARFGPAVPAMGEPRPIPIHLTESPNVLLVIVDTLRADVLSLYGGNNVETPTLERFAEEGTVFRAAFAQASWTKPSIASILTSLYPSSHRAVLKPSRLPDSVVTLAEAFSAFGYTTGGIVTNINLSPSFNFQQGFGEYRYLAPDYLFGARDSTSRLLLYEVAKRVAGRLAGALRPGQAYQPAEVVNRVAVEWLERHGSERFFLLLHYMEPHDPYFTHPDDGHAVARATTPDPAPELREDMVRRYYSEIAYLDHRLGELVAELERRGLYEDLLILVTSDHGEEFLDHGGWWHGLTLYDEQIGVPLIAKWPRRGRGAPPRWNGQVRLIDIPPTLLALVEAPAPPSMQGEDLLAGTDHERTVYAEEDHEGNVLQALRAGGWKLIRANPGNPRGLSELELYHVSDDIGEKENVAEGEPTRAQTLLGELITLEFEAQAQPATGETAEISSEDCEKLKALGYVEDCR
jgi:arylsulfatase A-like enzyme